MAQFLRKEAPQIKLRLASSNEANAEKLRQEFPEAEVIIADFLDSKSMDAAVAGIEGFYISTPMNMLPQMREVAAIFAEAVKKSGTAVHIIRQLAMQPEYNAHAMPEPFKTMVGGEYSDSSLKSLMDKTGLPITYLNFGATFMDNIIYLMGRAIREERKMIWHHRKCPFVDPRDLAEAAARLLLSDNHRHIGVCHTMNNGNDNLRYSQVADMMTEIYGEKIEYVGDKDSFLEEYAPSQGPLAAFLWEFFEFEESFEVGWALNDFAENILGRKPTTVREWLIEHRAQVLGE